MSSSRLRPLLKEVESTEFSQVQEPVRTLTPRNSLRSVLCQKPVFEGGEIGSFLNSRANKERDNLVFFPSPRAEGKVRNFYKLQSLYEGDS